jgi:hypothetical protein
MSLSPRKLRTPEESGTAVVEPPFAMADELLEHNRRLSGMDFGLGGRSAAALRRGARTELVAAARQYTAAYRDVPSPADETPRDIFLAGHQPQMFHPGVWLKNFALGRLAAWHGAVGINLLIDSDVARPTALRVPDGTGEKPEAASIAFDRPEPAVPYEERRVEDAALISSFAERVRPRLEPLGIEPLLTAYWPMVRERIRVKERLGTAVAQARHQLEAAWGLHTLEIPQSEVCDLPAFQFFTAFLLAELPRFLPVYNGAVVEYRCERRIRSAAHPVPDLAVEGDWREAPLWIWTAGDPQRRRLFARHAAGEIVLSDRHQFEARLPGDNPQAAAERLADLRRGGVKIRSKALITTLWARLFLGNLFIHGIGGGNYDQVTDRIIERFFRVPPPAFMVLSGTLHLPIHADSASEPGRVGLEFPGRHAPALNSNIIQKRLRELTYHPEKFLNTNSAGPEIETLTAEKRRWIGTPQTKENAQVRCQAIRRINEQLQPILAGERELLLATQRVAVAKEEAEKILRWREYAFCLYPEATLREFLGRLLAEVE